MLLVQLIHLLLTNPLQFIAVILMLIVPLLLSITFHEWSHGYVAYKFGDPTPKMHGRLTLNPFAHLDPLGTLMLFLVGIGWAKPVPIDILNIPDKTKQMLVALAGPMSNILLAIIFSIILAIITISNESTFNSAFPMLSMTINLIIRINLILALFNLIPIPPLDGSRVIAWLLPEPFALKYYYLEPYGIAVLFIILFSGGFQFLIKAVDLLQSKLIEVIKTFILHSF